MGSVFPHIQSGRGCLEHDLLTWDYLGEHNDPDLIVPAENVLLTSEEFGTLNRTSLVSSLALYVNLM